MEVIEWTPQKLARFKRAYEKCNTNIFVFEGHEFLKAYAKYLIEYLETALRQKGVP